MNGNKVKFNAVFGRWEWKSLISKYGAKFIMNRKWYTVEDMMFRASMSYWQRKMMEA